MSHKNPLKIDPTRTLTLRKRFQADVLRRVKELQKRIFKLIVTDDAFALKPVNETWLSSTVIFNTRWQFQTEPEQVRSFEQWLGIQFADLGLEHFSEIEQAFWHTYITQAYMKGVNRAFVDVRKPALQTEEFFEGTRQEFLRASFGVPPSLQKVKLLSGRVLTDLKGVNQTTATQLQRVLIDGFAAGDGPREIARAITNQVNKIEKTRALTIARTEVIRAHAEGQLDAMEKLGVHRVGVAVEWSTTGDNKVCPLCQPLEGIILTLKEARKTSIPRHPNCRCSWIPANVGESDPSIKKTRSRIQRSIERSLRAEIPKKAKKSRRTKTQRRLSTWKGADTTISKTRPKEQ